MYLYYLYLLVQNILKTYICMYVSNKESWEIKANYFTSVEYVSIYYIFNSFDKLLSVWPILHTLFVWPYCLDITSKWQLKTQHDTQHASPSLLPLEENK